ncbi:hypothetical protein PHJA_000090400 [Phtheirospermum japonicum]|uniref:Uncharacterized protein n=1 Tax=Phtheirospermum japonicum TaxID=374723 RepID=A0A830B292_9LAMI|nr:hypothetical protein PHJA_000090400 [Phtheirospermum japonicum]
MPSPSTPSHSSPLQLRGFLTGDTVQLQGDTGELQFSVQFNVHRKDHHHQQHSATPLINRNQTRRKLKTFPDCVQSLPPSPSYLLTPTSSSPDNQDCNENAIESFSRGDILTRLRSGVLSPVSYYRDRNYGVLSCGRRKKASKGKRKADNVFDKMLKRRSFPIRPCNSYAFFLMANWGVIKSCSFEETSKRLSKKWYKLSHDKKKVCILILAFIFFPNCSLDAMLRISTTSGACLIFYVGLMMMY